jgi:hypothetical protein
LLLLHLQSLDVLAEVVAVTLELSCEELLFGFSLDNWDNYVEQASAHATCLRNTKSAFQPAYVMSCCVASCTHCQCGAVRPLQAGSHEQAKGIQGYLYLSGHRA